MKVKKTALITGASSGLGREFCRQLGKQCDLILAVARNEAQLVELQKELAGTVDVQIVQADLATVEGVARSIEALRQKGPVDILVNNAGMSTYGPFAEQEIDSQHYMVSLQVNAMMALCRAAIPFMKEKRAGSIINVSSVSSFVPYADMTAYGGCKAFITAFSEALALELNEFGIHVQSLCPGLVRTGFHSTDTMAAFQLSGIPEDYWGQAENVVAASLAALGNTPVIFAPGDTNRENCRAGVERMLAQLV